MSLNVDKCSVMHIGHNNMQSNYNMSNQELPTKDIFFSNYMVFNGHFRTASFFFIIWFLMAVSQSHYPCLQVTGGEAALVGSRFLWWH